jgi:hypothetical protein
VIEPEHRGFLKDALGPRHALRHGRAVHQEIRLPGQEKRRDLAPQRFKIEAPLLHRRLLGEDLAGLDRHLSPPPAARLEQQVRGGDLRVVTAADGQPDAEIAAHRLAVAGDEPSLGDQRGAPSALKSTSRCR